ncbi:hypothetical protein A5634_26260 [Mycobacterium asiaticum]|uniref:GtrA/DPMS transmembrane domain-containing protein n=1 Tax=Mycobacterium asiaticum TaxID=1790 RepID=A0A1A3NYQ8_MYCAS|nr:GtrA family protein [Mycobacterium asiaticum]OBK25472.1 hypothetical protein A5634_26260 [Mycobacterium asiaticum]
MRLVGGVSGYGGMATSDKRLRYVAVALVFLALGQGLIQLFGLWLHHYTAASFLAAGIVTVPNFLANKRFVWRVGSGPNLRTQALAFWFAVMLAVSLATCFTYLVEKAMVGEPRPVQGAVVFLVQVLGFGVVWIGRYFLLDRWFSSPATYGQILERPLAHQAS